MDSPDYLRLSLAAAMELGLAEGTFWRDARLHCVNLLLTYQSGCRAACAFCGLSRRSRQKSIDKKFIRVAWKAHPVDLIVERLKERRDRGVIQRVCLSMITHPRAKRDTLLLTERIARQVDLPLSLLISPTVLVPGDLRDLENAGAERIGVAVDCATPKLFDSLRGGGVNGPHQWDHYWRIYESAISIFGRDMVGVHLICGLGETEKELVGAMQRARDLGGSTHLFSFFPERSSALAERTPPPMDVFRRIQLARFLIDRDLSRMDQMAFDLENRIAHFGVGDEVTEPILNEGEAWRTSGCPGVTLLSACNRPFANERPGEPIRNFPFAPDEEDKRQCRAELLFDRVPAVSSMGGIR